MKYLSILSLMMAFTAASTGANAAAGAPDPKCVVKYTDKATQQCKSCINIADATIQAAIKEAKEHDTKAELTVSCQPDCTEAMFDSTIFDENKDYCAKVGVWVE